MKTLTPRQHVVLQTLFKAGQPVRGRELYDRCIPVPEFNKVYGGDFWFADFSELMKSLTKLGLTQKWKVPPHKVYYALTDKSEEALQDPKTLKRRRKGRFKSAMYRYLTSDEFIPEYETGGNFKTIMFNAQQALGDEVVISILEKEYVKYRVQALYYQSKNWSIEHPVGNMTKVAELIKGFVDNFSEREMELHQQAVKLFRKKHAEEAHTRIENIELESLGTCYFCGSSIHNKEAAEDAKLLERFTGVKTGVACCSCMGHLKWVKEYLGGETKQ